MRRRLLTLISVGSLLLCVAVCVLWVRSYESFDLIGCETGDGESAVLSHEGRFIFVRSDDEHEG